MRTVHIHLQDNCKKAVKTVGLQSPQVDHLRISPCVDGGSIL